MHSLNSFNVYFFITHILTVLLYCFSITHQAIYKVSMLEGSDLGDYTLLKHWATYFTITEELSTNLLLINYLKIEAKSQFLFSKLKIYFVCFPLFLLNAPLALSSYILSNSICNKYIFCNSQLVKGSFLFLHELKVSSIIDFPLIFCIFCFQFSLINKCLSYIKLSIWFF